MFKRDYNFHEIEEKWQAYWEKNKTFKTENTSNKPKYYVLDMFPYPSGNGLHVGHPKGYVGSDIIARYKRMKGFNVLHPMGWDSFGLPTERQSVKENTHPNLITKRNVDTFRNQLKIIGLGYDWDRELATSHESYYKWTQWIFLKLFEKGLAYRAEIPVNWCPALGTVLSNEEVKDGKYVETGDDVEKRLMSQWMLKITAYADRLVEDLELVDWPESVKEMQKNWIGKSEGASVKFNIENSDKTISVFTTRPDTLFGCSYVVLAPEHQLVKDLITEAQKEVVNEYIEKTGKLSERDRISGTEKTGVFTGSYAICPVNNKKVQIWISDYVLATYGTGAVFACPAHDERDYEFAKKFQLDIIEVVKGGNITEAAYTEDGEHVNSEFLDGLKINEAKTKVISWLEANNAGKSEINYKLRDWLFSRQRYWGEPIPILINKKDGSIKAVPESELPILLPHLDDLTPPPDGRPPLSKATEWVNYNDEYERETNTMPQWAGSCWYYLRFIDPTNTEFAWDKELEKAMMPVDLYIGGTEHATLHLLYARFWHKFLYDLGYVSTKEPFKKLFNQGLIQAQSYQDEAGKYYYPKEVYEKDDKWFSRDGDKPLRVKVEKMSKSRHNVTTPDEVIENYGADSLRLYELFIGPLEDGAVWQTDNISGVKRLLDRVWNLFTEEKMEKENTVLDKKLEIVLNQTIKKITEDIEALHFNTSISQLMIFVNELYKHNTIPVSVLETLIKLLSPFAPHMAEELWERLGHEPSIALVAWPEYDPSKVVESEIEIPVQINGKLRATVSVPRDADEATVKEAALKAEAVSKAIEGKTIAKVIYVTNKIFNLIIKG